jgi:type II secretory pathway pseudopilin PulG
MERSNQPPKTEDCLAEGRPADLKFHRKERLSRSVSRDRREPQAGPASGLSNSASIRSSASGEGVVMSESKTDPSVKGKEGEGLPGSESVARAAGNTRNEGDPKSPCRTNYESQAGREAQPKGVPSGASGVGLVHSSQQQGASPEAGEGTNRSTQSAQATRTVRTTEEDWQTFLRAIAEKASTDKRRVRRCLASRSSANPGVPVPPETSCGTCESELI